MENYYRIIKEVLPSVTLNDLEKPIRETGIDSLDLIIIRVALEKYYGIEISDSEWYKSNSLSEAYTIFKQNSIRASTCVSTSLKKIISVSRRYEIGMPQMSVKALSEFWLLKELGDIHWQLISQGIEQKLSELSDGLGNRLYATFVRIQYNTSPLVDYQEDTILTLEGSIKRYGNNTYLSEIKGINENRYLEASLMTAFSQREASSNSKILKGNPYEKINHIESLEYTPEFLNQYKLLRKGLLDEIIYDRHQFNITDKEIANKKYKIRAYYEINGVGLLYFSSYPIISDSCVADIMKILGIETDLELNYYTSFRDIFYFANCDLGDNIIVRLNEVEVTNNCIKFSTSLYRESDNVLIARVFTIKYKR